MKRNIFKIGSLLLSMAILTTSCLKDDSLILDPEQGTNVVEFGNTGTPTSPSGAPLFAYTPITLEVVPTASFVSYVNYAGPEDVAPQDITVQLEAAPEAITKWNAAYPNATAAAKYNQLPNGTYSFPATVTIPKGQKRAEFTISLKPDQFNSAISNVLGIKIASTNFSTVSGNFGTVIYNLPLKSVFDGLYNFAAVCPQDGNINGYTEEDVQLSTVAPNRVRSQYLARTYSGFVEYQFNAAGTAITELKAYNGATTYVTTIVSQSVDPVTNNFTITWTLLGRVITETWTRQP